MHTDKNSLIKVFLQSLSIGVYQCYQWFQKKPSQIICANLRPSADKKTSRALVFVSFRAFSWLDQPSPSIGVNRCYRWFKKIRFLLVSLFLCLTSSLPLHANISEPDTIFYGQVFHSSDQPILAGNNEVKIKAIVDGEILAEYPLKAGNHNYALRIPMDNGGLPSLDGTAQPGDNVFIVIENFKQAQTYAVSETQLIGYTIPNHRGSVILLDLHITTDVGTITDTSTSYSDWLAQNFSSAELNDSNLTDEQADPDGDGRSNLTEYALGLNPRDPNDVNEGVEMEVRGNALGQRHLYVTFNQRLNDPSLVYLPQVSDDKQTWSSNFTKLREYNRTDLEGGSFQRVTYQDLTSGAPGQPRHFQLTIERQN